ncbi:MAG: pilin [Acholeplasmatales bacterium]|nr:pilin [Acholeplasmatales bacterium]
MTSLFLETISSSKLKSIAQPILDICEAVIPVLLAVVTAIGAIYCILLGVRYAKADDQQEHDKAKKALKNAIIGFVLIFVLLVMLYFGTDVFENWYESQVNG